MAPELNSHGGDALSVAAELGLPLGEVLDFSASINPLGPPAGVLEAAQDALDEVIHYPEIQAESLRLALAEYHGLPEVCLLPGAGSTELLYLFSRVLRPRRALVVEPAFGEYHRALTQADCTLDRVLLRPGDAFRCQVLLDRLTDETDLVLLANPGNPTGAGIDPNELRNLLDLLPSSVRLAVDEAFVDFCPELSLMEKVVHSEQLFLFRSLTKFYAIPGLRVGYLAGPPGDMTRLAEAHQPWSLSTPAIAAAIAALQADKYRLKTLEVIPGLREELAHMLVQLGFEIFPGRANYLFCCGREGMQDLCARLRSFGILLRNCQNFAGLDDRYIRVAVRSAEENRQLIAALKKEMNR